MKPAPIPEPNELLPMDQAELDEIAEQHQVYLNGSRGGARANFKFRDLSGLSLKGYNLSQADFTASRLVGADLSHGIFEAACFFACDLRHASLEHAAFLRADFRGAYIAGANLSGADLASADFREGKIMTCGKAGELVDRQRSGDAGARTIFRGARLAGTNLSGTHAKAADFKDADLSGVLMVDADLSGVNFEGANLSDADLTGANLSNANMRSSILAGTNLTAAELHGADRTGALTDDAMGDKLEALEKSLTELLEEHTLWVASAGKDGRQLNLSGYDLRDVIGLRNYHMTAIKALGANFVHQDLRGMEMQSATLDRSDFRDANMQGADFRGSSLKYAQLARADLRDANFGPLQFDREDGGKRLQRANLAGVNFRYADLRGTVFHDCILMGADLSFAQLAGCDFRKADLSGILTEGTSLDKSILTDAITD